MNFNNDIRRQSNFESFKVMTILSLLFLFVTLVYIGIILLSDGLKGETIQRNILFGWYYIDPIVDANGELIKPRFVTFKMSFNFYMVTSFLGISTFSMISSFLLPSNHTKKQRNIWTTSTVFIFLITLFLYLMVLGFTPKPGKFLIASNPNIFIDVLNDTIFFGGTSALYYDNSINGDFISLHNNLGNTWLYLVFLSMFLIAFILCSMNSFYIFYGVLKNNNVKVSRKDNMNANRRYENDEINRNKKSLNDLGGIVNLSDVKNNKTIEQIEERKSFNKYSFDDDMLENETESVDDINARQIMKLFENDRFTSEKKIEDNIIDEQINNNFLDGKKSYDKMIEADKKSNPEFKKFQQLQEKYIGTSKLEEEFINNKNKENVVNSDEYKWFKKIEENESINKSKTSENFPTIRLKKDTELEKLTNQRFHDAAESVRKLKETRGPLITKVELSQEFIDSLNKDSNKDNVVVKETSAKVIKEKKETFIDKEIKERLRKFYE